MSNETSVRRNVGNIVIEHKADAAVASTVADRDCFIATSAWRVVSVKEAHATASTSGTAALRKITDTSAPGASASSTVIELLGSALDLSTTANTVVTATLVSDPAKLTLKPGDRLAFDFGGTMTSLAGCLIQIELAPATKYR